MILHKILCALGLKKERIFRYILTFEDGTTICIAEIKAYSWKEAFLKLEKAGHIKRLACDAESELDDFNLDEVSKVFLKK